MRRGSLVKFGLGLWDITGFNNLIDEMKIEEVKKVILKDMCEAEMDAHLQYGKSDRKPEVR